MLEGGRNVLQRADALAVDFLDDAALERGHVGVDRVLENLAEHDHLGVFAVKVVGDVVIEKVTQARVDVLLRVEEVAAERLEEEAADEDEARTFVIRTRLHLEWPGTVEFK